MAGKRQSLEAGFAEAVEVLLGVLSFVSWQRLIAERIAFFGQGFDDRVADLFLRLSFAIRPTGRSGDDRPPRLRLAADLGVVGIRVGLAVVVVSRSASGFGAGAIAP